MLGALGNALKTRAPGWGKKIGGYWNQKILANDKVTFLGVRAIDEAVRGASRQWKSASRVAAQNLQGLAEPGKLSNDPTLRQVLQNIAKEKAEANTDALGLAMDGLVDSRVNTSLGFAQEMGGIAKDLVTPSERFGGVPGLVGRAGVYGAASIAGRYMSGGTLTRNKRGERDIVGIPFI